MKQKLLTLLTLLVVCVTVGADPTYHTIVPNNSSTEYETYGLYSLTNSSKGIAEGYTTWISGSVEGRSATSYTAPTGWLDAASGKPGYGTINIKAQTITFYVTNCVGVAIVSKSGGGSRTCNLSVKDASTNEEVGTVATNGNTLQAVAYGTPLSASKNYIITLSGSDTGSNQTFHQIRFTAPYTVTHNLTNVTKTNGEATATKGVAYNAVFAANSGYTLPDAITVTIGGNAATSGTDYTWNSTTGAFQVPAAKVTGAIVVTITGVEEVTADKYDITFAKGANTSATMPDAVNASNVTLDEIDSDNNYRFDGWKADKDVHETTLDGTTITAGTLITAGTKVYVTQATTFTAQWTQKYAVTFNSNGGSAVETQYIASGEAAEEPTAPTRTNYTFEGWQLSGADYNFSTAVTAAITLDAVWSRNTITNNSSDVVISSGTTLNTGGILSVSASPSAGTSGGGIYFAGNITDGSDKPTRYIQFTVPTGATATVKTITVTSNSVIIRDDIDGITLNKHVYYKTDNTAEYNKIMPAGTYYIGRGVGSGTVMTACTLTLSSPALTVTVKTLGQDDQVIKVTSGETLGNIFLSGTLPTPVVDGYVFNGWKNADDDTDVTASTVISGSMTIYAALTPDAESVSATIPSSGWGTYCSKYNLDFSDASTEVLAYAVSAFDAESLTVTYEKQTGVVPAGTGLLLYGETGSKTIATTGDEGTAPAVNKLEGFLSATPYSADGDVRYLGMSGGSWLEMTAGTIPAGKAALKITSAEMSTVQAKVAGGAKFTIIYDDGETTGIESIHNSQFTIHTDAPMYNLSGQRVSESYKGIVIVNGRKVIRK